MRTLAAVISLVAIAATAFGACGGDDDEDATTVAGNEIDRALVAEMVPHHKAAIEMAEIAQERGQSGFVRSLAEDIIRSQGEEIDAMEDIDAELADVEVEPGDLGLSEAEMGPEHDIGELESAPVFDREFIDMMIPHHEAAIRMARVEIQRGENEDLKEIARAIIDAQRREIEAMDVHRLEEFGPPSPGGAH
jgi:uncharacterized protein (DUF305 family)